MKVALLGPSELTEYDKREIERYIQTVVKDGHTIKILAYNSIEIETFKFFLRKENIEFASQLSIYTFPLLDNLPNRLKASIDYLVLKGATYHSFEHKQMVVFRSAFIDAWRKIIAESDLVVSFYDQEKTSLMIPLDIAKEMGKRAIKFTLPGSNFEMLNATPDKKIQVILKEDIL